MEEELLIDSEMATDEVTGDEMATDEVTGDEMVGAEMAGDEMAIVETTGNDVTYGTVKWFSRMKGWGFIEPDGADRDVFVHYESIIGEGFRNLEKGERVQFDIIDTPKGPKATNVLSVEGAPAF